MPDRSWQEKLTHFYLFISFIGFSALWYSEFVVSMATALAGVVMLISIPIVRSSVYKNLFLSTFLIVGLVALHGLFTDFGSTTSAKTLLALGMSFILVASFVMYEIATQKQQLFVLFAIVVVVLIINLISVSGYWANKTYYDQMLLQSKSIPIPNMHHIHFGVINAICILTIVGVWVREKSHTLQPYFLVVGILILICFHILSSRTGLLAFYGGSMIALLVYAIRNKAYKVLIIGPLALAILAILAYVSNSSLQSKIDNSIEDIQSWGHDDEINHKSMAMRIEAYKMCAQVIYENPLGVGAEEQDQTQHAMYNKQSTSLTLENRVGPHNQWFEYGVKYGWLGIVLFCIFVVQWFKLLPASSHYFWGIVAVFVISMFFESLLDRQKSIFFSMTLLPLAYHILKKDSKME